MNALTSPLFVYFTGLPCGVAWLDVCVHVLTKGAISLCHSPVFITLMQISQMLVGVGVTAAAYSYQADPSCAVVRDLIPWCAAMYATYLYFFVEFFVERFLAASTKRSPVSKLASKDIGAAPSNEGRDKKKT